VDFILSVVPAWEADMIASQIDMTGVAKTDQEEIELNNRSTCRRRGSGLPRIVTTTTTTNPGPSHGLFFLFDLVDTGDASDKQPLSEFHRLGNHEVLRQTGEEGLTTQNPLLR
jgi:hypothetical protein